MAAILPAINSPSNKSGVIQQHHALNGSKSKSAASGSQIHVIQLSQGYRGKRELEQERRNQRLRAQQPLLNERQASQYRNSYKHTLSLDMLQGGYHKSFAELFNLVKKQNEERYKAGPESVLWNQVLLEDQHEKLDKLKYYLSLAETAQRGDLYVDVYKFRYELARFFQRTGDKWLADHFFDSCLSISQYVDGDDGYLAAQSHCNVGLAQEESGDNLGASENFEVFHRLCEKHIDWVTEDGSSTMQASACTHLTRIYTTIAKQYEVVRDLPQFLEYLLKAYNMAKESGDRTLEGESAYRLGLAYEKNKDSRTALVYLTSYFDTCQAMGDTHGMGKACEAMAKSYDSEGKVEESIKFLEKFVEVAEKSKDDKALSQACSDLGAMFNSLGRYEQAVEYFNKSYTISRAMNDTETISSSRVLFGVAAAHKMLEHVATHIDISTRPCIERLIEWKDNRGDKFEKPLPASAAGVSDKTSRSSTDMSDKTQSQSQNEEQSGSPEDEVAEKTANDTDGGGTTRESTDVAKDTEGNNTREDTQD